MEEMGFGRSGERVFIVDAGVNGMQREVER